MDGRLLRRTAEIATEYLSSVSERPVRPEASLEELRAALRIELGDEPVPAMEVIEELVAGVEPGLVHVQSPRYYGFVVGGGLDAAIAADWLTSTWDQNGVGYPVGPSAAVVEEVVCEWLLDLLGLPADAGIGLTTGCQLAHFTCLASARHRVLADAGWDVEADGLFGAPPIRVLLGAKAHTTVVAALRMLGLGGARLEPVPADDQGRMQVADLADALQAGGTAPAIVVAQVGEVNTGAIDDMPRVVELAREHGAWCHVDGAFGLWAAASPALRHLVEGAADADSWATDCHKLLNVPYDCGLAIVRDRAAQAAAMNSFTGVDYLTQPEHDERYQSEWVPEFSRRARGFTAYAALRELGRRGVAELVERCCAHARLIADLLGAEDGVTVLGVGLNQTLLRFEVDGTNVTDDVIARVQREGTCWMSGTRWDGEPAMRVSVCNWRSTEQDIRRSASAILAQMPLTPQPSL